MQSIIIREALPGAMMAYAHLMALRTDSHSLLIRASLARFLQLTPAEVRSLGAHFDGALEHAGQLADSLPVPSPNFLTL